MRPSRAVAAASAFSLALAAAPAVAEPNSPASPALVPSAAALGLRSSKPLSLAPKEETPSYFKGLLAVVVLAGGAYVVIRKRRGIPLRPSVERRGISVRHRVALGHKNELLVVETSGVKLLLGMTPGSIQTLATLDTEAESTLAEESTSAASPSLLEPFAARMASLLRTQAATEGSVAPKDPKEDAEAEEDGFEGQAKGLAKLRRIR